MDIEQLREEINRVLNDGQLTELQKLRQAGDLWPQVARKQAAEMEILRKAIEAPHATFVGIMKDDGWKRLTDRVFIYPQTDVVYDAPAGTFWCDGERVGGQMRTWREYAEAEETPPPF